ncbi:MAG: hypothetical protein O3A00_15845 [Planctomycetota bacterium]|nr:hypothetical protein [Planctomycetota bacterium]
MRILLVVLVGLVLTTLSACSCSDKDKKPSLTRRERAIVERRQSYGLATPGLDERR